MTWFRRRQSPELSADAAREADGHDEAQSGVAGERGFATVNRPPSLQSRVSNLMAMGLMSTLAVGFLGWYYLHAVAARKAAASTAQAGRANTAQGEMALPPLGRIDPPRPTSPSAALEQALGPAPADPPKFDAATPAPGVPPAPYNTYGTAPPAKTPAELALERRLAGPVFSGPTASSNSAGSSGAAGERTARPLAIADRQTDTSDLGNLLRPTTSATVEANVLPTQRLLLPKGAFLDCTLETAIDSTLPGMTTCVLATDTFSADGSVVLLERGTKLVGETRGQVAQGASRLFVLWTEARTPTGVIVPLASPGTDELGRSGLSGEVNRHFWQRFGAAILVTVIEGAVQGAVASQSNGGTVLVNPATTTDVTTEVLKSTIAIPPTISKANGDRIQVFVARDLDFRSVYDLRPVR